MARRIVPCADIWTGHVRPPDLPLLLREDAPYFLCRCPTGFFSFFRMPEDEEWEAAKKEWGDFGFSHAFLDCMFAARWEGCPYVRFDGDGARWPELAVHCDD